MSTDTTTPPATDALAGALTLKGTIGNVGLPGAPVAQFLLTVSPGTSTVNGTVVISQAIAPPFGHIVVPHVTGQIHTLVFGAQVTRVITIQGDYFFTLPPPAIGTFTEKFTAHMVLDNSWNGRGGFSYGGRQVENVPVKATAS